MLGTPNTVTPTIGSAERVVLTGSTGFIGSRLLAALVEDGHDVLVIRRRGTDEQAPRSRGVSPSGFCRSARVSEVVDPGDARELSDELVPWRPTVCVHLATSTGAGANPSAASELLESNTVFPVRVAEAVLAAGAARFINASTFMQRREGRRHEAVNGYAASKNAFSAWLEHLSERRGLQVVDAQLYDTIGTGDVRGKVWRACARAAATGTELPVTAGGQVVSPAHVRDVVDAFRRLVHSDQPNAPWVEHHFPGPATVTFREAVAVFSDVIGREVPVVWGARPYPDSTMFELWRSGTEPEWWKPPTQMRSGFAELWQEALEEVGAAPAL